VFERVLTEHETPSVAALRLAIGEQTGGHDGSLYGVLNGVTYYTDHQRGRSADTRLNSAWFGDGDRLKRTALRTLWATVTDDPITTA
jgi:hypothetical protein